MKIEVTRAFSIAGERQEVGTELDVDIRFARELIHNAKARPATEKSAEPPVEEKPATRRSAREKTE